MKEETDMEGVESYRKEKGERKVPYESSKFMEDLLDLNINKNLNEDIN